MIRDSTRSFVANPLSTMFCAPKSPIAVRGRAELIDLKVIRETPILEILGFLIDLKSYILASPISL